MRRRSVTLKANLCEAHQRDLKTIGRCDSFAIASADSFDRYYRLSD